MNNRINVWANDAALPGARKTLTITVGVIGDGDVENNETFFVNLSNPTNATIGDGQGMGTINNDDVIF